VLEEFVSWLGTSVNGVPAGTWADAVAVQVFALPLLHAAVVQLAPEIALSTTYVFNDGVLSVSSENVAVSAA
jgi:hypothetical protein